MGTFLQRRNKSTCLLVESSPALLSTTIDLFIRFWARIFYIFPIFLSNLDSHLFAERRFSVEESREEALLFS